MKYVALNDLHVSLGAKMIEFAGYNMPVLYNNLIQEHNAVRNSIGATAARGIHFCHVGRI